MLSKSELLTGVITAIAGASVIGGGTVVLNAQRDNSVQAEQIERLKDDNVALGGAVQKLDQSVQALDKSVAILNERMGR